MKDKLFEKRKILKENLQSQSSKLAGVESKLNGLKVDLERPEWTTSYSEIKGLRKQLNKYVELP